MERKIVMPDSQFRALSNFNKIYKVEKILCGGIRKKIGEPKKSCRFCSKLFPEVQFKKDAHVIPYFLNRTKLLSNFECDTCNGRFSKYESSLSEFLSLEKALWGSKRRKTTIPKLKSKDGTVVQTSLDIDSLLNHFSLDSEFEGRLRNGEIKLLKINSPNSEGQDIPNVSSISIDIPPYSPANVFKALMKIGICFLAAEDCKLYSEVLSFLGGNSNPSTKHSFLHRITINSLCNFFPDPWGVLLKQKSEIKNTYNRMFVLYYGNRVFQIPLMSDSELLQYRDKSMLFFQLPIFFNPWHILKDQPEQHFVEALEDTSRELLDMSSAELRTDHGTLWIELPTQSLNSDQDSHED